ncbi:MAG: acetate--CoA ligase family protein [Deltaproteobacteria bacterium]|jgi:acetate---CoA ligase (ADP-forming) subunit beta|nr:acetate--CoA ligase family protein [Deltaproteobacteria bacterium]
MKIIERALEEGQSTLSEYESKQILSSYGIPVTKEFLVNDLKELMSATREIGYPLVLKGCSSEIAHKTEKGLIKIDIRNEEAATSTFEEIKARIGSDAGILVQEMVKGQRELVVGLTRDPQFGPCVMFGLGGIFTEILKDISFRVAPLEKRDALEMMRELKSHKILGAIRGMPAADVDRLAKILINVGRIGLENKAVKEIDINPIIISGNKPVAVDALVVLG